MTAECIFLRRSDGHWQCQRRRCRYVTKRAVYEKPPRRICKGGGPGTLLSHSLAFFGVTEERWLRFRRRLNPRVQTCGCQERAQKLDRIWYTSRWTAPLRAWMANYAANLKRLAGMATARRTNRHAERQDAARK